MTDTTREREREREQNLFQLELRNRFSEKIKRILFGFEDRLYELVNGYEFSGVVPTKDLVTDFKNSLEHAYAYMPMWNRNIRALLKEAYKREMRFDNLLDIGAGKGKPCIYAGKKHAYNKIIGVEFSQPLIEIAEKNRVKSNLPNLSFVNCDATQYFLPEGLNLIFLVNPFDDDTLSKFIQLNLNHFKDQHSVIAYLNDVHRNTLTKFGFETFFRDQTRKISLYQLT